ncbi:hypothetical protein N9Y37_10875 [Luminiphilus sp.]|nr:hypothetical protein [Luminiphilus sp.]
MGKYLRYLKQSTKANRTLTFQKAWPTKLADAVAQANLPKLFAIPTDCPVTGTTEEQLRWQKWGLSQYDKQIALLKVAAQTTPSTGITIVPFARNTDGAVATHDGKPVLSPANVKRKRLYDRKALRQTMDATNTVAELHDLWQRQHAEEGKAKADRLRYWNEWLEYFGQDEAAAPRALDSIHRAFDSWQEHMLARGLAPSAVERARGSVRAILRWASRRLRIGWQIDLQELPAHQPASKRPLTPEQQAHLMQCVLAHSGPTAAMVAVMLAGGVMPSEIGNLDPDATTLNASNPYIVIGADGAKVKAEARRRIVPIVWSAEVLEVIRTHLPEAIARSSNAKAPSATVNKWLKARGIPTTGHGLRHTFAGAAQVARINPMDLARIGGWTMAGTGISTQALEYGRSMDESELIAGLTDSARQVWAHLLPDTKDGQTLRLVR